MSEADTTQLVESQETIPVYMYGILPSQTELPADLTGINDGEVELVIHGALAAVVTVLHPDAEVGTPDNLLAHSAVLDAIAVHAPVLPMAFGTIIPSEAELIQNVLLPNENEHSALLEHFTGSVQFTVRARYLRDEVLADLVAENPDVARLRETIAGTTETQTRQARIQLGELIVQAFDQIRPHHAEHIVTAIQPVVQQMQQREVGQVEDVVELAVLVSSDEVKRFEDALESVASELHARIDFQLLGPQAPYDFVGIDE